MGVSRAPELLWAACARLCSRAFALRIRIGRRSRLTVTALATKICTCMAGKLTQKFGRDSSEYPIVSAGPLLSTEDLL